MKVKFIISTLLAFSIAGLFSCTPKNDQNRQNDQQDFATINLSDNSFEGWQKNEFFGLNLDNDNQVPEFHKILVSGKYNWNNVKIEEWLDGFGSDFEMSGGTISTAIIFCGTAQDAQSIFYRMDNAFNERYQNREPLVQNEWIHLEDNLYLMTHYNFFTYKGYRIVLTLELKSPTKNEEKATAGMVRLGLGAID